MVLAHGQWLLLTSDSSHRGSPGPLFHTGPIFMGLHSPVQPGPSQPSDLGEVPFRPLSLRGSAGRWLPKGWASKAETSLKEHVLKSSQFWAKYGHHFLKNAKNIARGPEGLLCTQEGLASKGRAVTPNGKAGPGDMGAQLPALGCWPGHSHPGVGDNYTLGASARQGQVLGGRRRQRGGRAPGLRLSHPRGPGSGPGLGARGERAVSRESRGGTGEISLSRAGPVPRKGREPDTAAQRDIQPPLPICPSLPPAPASCPHLPAPPACPAHFLSSL